MKKKYGETELILETIRSDLEKYGAERKTITAAAICVEEMLYKYAEVASADTPVTFEVIRDAREMSVVLRVLCPDAPENAEADKLNILENTVKYMGFRVSHEHADGMNTDKLTVAKFFRTLDNLKFTFKYMGKDRKLIYCGLIAHIISIVANLVIPYMTGRLIVAYSDNALTQIIAVAIAITVCRCIYYITYRLASILYSKATFRMQAALHRALIDDLFLVQDEKLDEKGAGTFSKLITTDTDAIATGLSNMADILSQSLYYVGVLFAILAVDKIAFLASILLLVLLLLLERRRAYYLEIDHRRVFISQDACSGMILDLVNGTKEVKNLNAEEYLAERFSAFDQQHVKDIDHSHMRTACLSALNGIVMSIGYCSIMLYLGFGISKGSITIPNALVMFNYFTIIGMPVINLIQRAIDFKKEYGLASERVRTFIEGSEYPKEKFGKEHREHLKGEITLNDVSFAYNHNNPLEKDHLILKHMNLTVRPGEKIALIGRSGSGKTTAFKLITRQRDCTEGSVTIDGMPVEGFDRDSLRGNISVISQFPYIFNATVKENLLIARPDATMEEIEAACEKACILEDIRRMQNGFDTMMGEKGVRFSGGQAQRLAIARAFLCDTPILLLDEATSAVDNVAQKGIMESVDSEDRTVLMIAHRLSTIRSMDRIAVLSGGRIIAEGTHDELIESCGEYRELYLSEK